ncbi:hypothetical protein AB0E27_20285 [Streptomyces sparsogenes]|uniref:hypothetical protein n=1 Tax=Streptomyces sparsogenes TaxID=67365 RepID=UPI0034099F04
MNGLLTLVLGVATGLAVIGLLTLARTAGVRPAPRPAPAFRPVAEGTVWRPCHDTACGHTATRWLRGPDGTYRCERAAEHRGDVHLTHTTDTRGSAS